MPYSCAACWSPKGKQIVQCLKDGSLCFDDEELSEKRKLPVPASLLDGGSLGAVVWLETSVLVVAIANSAADDYTLVLVHLQVSFT